jgi:hypothetical protein
MQSQQERLLNICKGTLGRIKGDDDCWVDCSGPHLIIKDDDQPDMGWTVMVTLRNPLIGRAPIGVSLGLVTLLPPDGAFEAATGMCLDKARAQREKNLHLAEEEAKAAMAEPAAPKLEAPKARRTRERESHFTSKPGSGFTEKDAA